MGKNNVNPGRYKTAGRERQGEDILQEVHKQKYRQAQVRHEAEADGDKEQNQKGQIGEVNVSANTSSSE